MYSLVTNGLYGHGTAESAKYSNPSKTFPSKTLKLWFFHKPLVASEKSSRAAPGVLRSGHKKVLISGGLGCKDSGLFSKFEAANRRLRFS